MRQRPFLTFLWPKPIVFLRHVMKVAFTTTNTDAVMSSRARCFFVLRRARLNFKRVIFAQGPFLPIFACPFCAGAMLIV